MNAQKSISKSNNDEISDAQNELLKKVRQIEIKTLGLSNQIFSGSYHSAFKGRGMSFSEVREYQYGDDVRSIDWNVTARYNNPFIKVFEEERELNVMLLIDISKSAYFGSGNKTKHELIVELASTIAFSASRNNDKVGVLFFSDKIEKFIPLKKGKSHVLVIIRELLSIQPKSSGTNINQALEYFYNINKKRSIAFILSDFMSTDYKKSLQQASKRHDIIGLHVYDPLDIKLPDVNIMQVIDSETAESIWIDTSDKKNVLDYNTAYTKRIESTKKMFSSIGVEFKSISTTDSYVQLLMNIFKDRSKRK
jgi:uncharacterized protein (DUF58 family)